jgi:formate-dependent nitrite reductase membrane component NrfD
VNESSVAKEGLKHERPEREATTGVISGRKKGREKMMVEPAKFRSYYGKPVINKPVWASPDIPGYLFLGGLAGASSLLGAGAQLSERRGLARVSKSGAAAAAGLSLVALVHDLGRPKRFLNMLRVFKPTSPMSVGSWILAAYVPAAGLAAVTELTGVASGLGSLATLGSAALGPAVAAYTAALISNTAVPAWHEGHKTMPFLFVASAASAGGGLGLAAAPLVENAPALRMGVLGASAEMVLTKAMEHKMHEEARSSYEEGKAKWFLRAAEACTAMGVIGAVLTGRRNRVGAVVSGAALVAGSACTRFGLFAAGEASALNPAATVSPQRERLEEAAT